MKQYIEKGALYDKTAAWEASAFAKVMELSKKPFDEMDEAEKVEWRLWTLILGERSAFKFDVADAPAIDAVEVVRCKDCKYYYDEEKWCSRLALCKEFDGNGFCSHGERKE